MFYLKAFCNINSVLQIFELSRGVVRIRVNQLHLSREYIRVDLSGVFILSLLLLLIIMIVTMEARSENKKRLQI